MWWPFLLACADVASGDLPPSADTAAFDTGASWVAAEVQLTSVRYLLDIDWSGAEWADDAYVFTTDLGYVVGLQQATLTTSTVELVPCDELDSTWRLDPSYLAHASHEHDASQVVVDRGIDLLGPTSVELGTATTGDSPYCQAYELLSIASDSFEVVRLRGWYHRADEAPTPFEVVSSVPATSLRPLVVLDGDPPSGDATVRLTRFPARSLDGIDLETVADIDLAFDASVRLSQHTRVSVPSSASTTP